MQASDAALGIGVRVSGSQRGDADPVVEAAPRVAAPRVLTFRPGATATAELGGDPFRQQDLLLGADVYARPEVTGRRQDGHKLAVQPDGTFHIPGTVRAPGAATLSARCSPGSRVVLWAPALVGEARLGSESAVPFLPAEARSPGAYSGAAMQELGTVGRDGVADVNLTVPRWSRVPAAALGCLDEAALGRAVDTLAASSPRQTERGGHGLHATVNAERGGLMVAAVPLVPGWSCAVDGQGRAAASFHGLLATEVPAGTHEVGCTFQPPGLNLGLLLAAGSILFLVGAAVAPAVVARRSARPPSRADHALPSDLAAP